jgi:hypothetical protein
MSGLRLPSEPVARSLALERIIQQQQVDITRLWKLVGDISGANVTSLGGSLIGTDLPVIIGTVSTSGSSSISVTVTESNRPELIGTVVSVTRTFSTATIATGKTVGAMRITLYTSASSSTVRWVLFERVC